MITHDDSRWSDLFSGKNAASAIALSLGVALHAINILVATTILPSVVQDIGGLDLYAWNTTLFVVASILGSALSARLLSGYGARNAYLVASLFFIAGAGLCALAPSMPVMLIGRTEQGFGGGLIFALSYAMINLVFEQRLWPRAMALISAMWGIATLVGPAVGGIFAELHAWRWAFGILLPIMALYAAFTFLILPKGQAQQAAAPLPTAQLLLLTVAVLVVSAGSLAHSVWINLAGIALSLALMAWLMKREARSRAPVAARYAAARLIVGGALYYGVVAGDRHDQRNLRALFPAVAARAVAADLRLYRRDHGRRLDVVRNPQLRLARGGHSPGDRKRAAVRAGGPAGAGDPDADALRRSLAGADPDRHRVVAGGILHRLRLAASADAHFAGGA